MNSMNLQLTGDETEALIVAWGIVTALLVKDALSASFILGQLRDPSRREVLNGLTKKLMPVLEADIDENLKKLEDRLA